MQSASTDRDAPKGDDDAGSRSSADTEPVAVVDTATLTDDADVPAVVMVADANTMVEAAVPEDVDPLAAAWQQPMLPAGESPWSEVISTRGAHHRSHAAFPGLDGDVPVAATTTVDSPRPTPVPYVPPVEDDVDPILVDAISGFDWRKIGAGAVVILVLFGLFALIARSGSDDDRTEIIVAPSSNEFKLDSEPSGATVIAVRDGRVLGKTPLEFLVPNRSRAQVILVAAGFEPLRLDLPERGGLRAQLSKLDATPCSVTITGVDNAKIEGVGFDIGDTKTITIPGAGVVRVALEQRLEGASIVYCPAMGGTPSEPLAVHTTPNPRTVRLTEPAGAVAYLNGDPVGRVPTTIGDVRTAFAHLRVDDASGMSEQRWVPTAEPIEIRMPMPARRKIPVLLVPDGLPRPAASPATPQTAIDTGTKTASEADEVDDDDADVEDDEVETATKRRLTRSQRRAKARRLLDEGTRELIVGNRKAARSKLKACIRYDPRLAECHRELGTLYRRQRRPRTARQYYLRYLELRPDARDAATIRRMLK